MCGSVSCVLSVRTFAGESSSQWHKTQNPGEKKKGRILAISEACRVQEYGAADQLLHLRQNLRLAAT
jgi:hypothetical protein